MDSEHGRRHDPISHDHYPRDYSPPGARDYSPDRVSDRRRRDHHRGPLKRDRYSDDPHWRRYDGGYSPPNKRARRDRSDMGWERDRDRKHRTKRYDDSPRHRRNSLNWRDNHQLFERGLLPIAKFIREIGGDHPDPEKTYADYQTEFAKRTVQRFFDNHRHESWMREKYHPTQVLQRFDRAVQLAVKESQLFESAIRENQSSFQLDYQPEKDPNSKLISNSNSEALGATEETESSSMNVQSDEVEFSTVVQVKDIPPSLAWDQSKVEILLKTQRDLNAKDINQDMGLDEFRFSPFVDVGNGYLRSVRMTFSSVDQAKQAASELQQSRILKDANAKVIHLPASDLLPRYSFTPSISASESQISKDLAKAKSLVEQLDKEKNLIPCQVLSDDYPEKDLLDIHVGYLRNVHFYCYYCGEEFSSPEEMQERCGTLHFRGPSIPSSSDSSEVNPSDSTWLDELDKKNDQRIQSPLSIDVLSGKTALKTTQEDFYDGNMKKIEEKKFRCMMPDCGKLFRGPEFVIKHLNLKHKSSLDKIQAKIEQERYFENFKSEFPEKLKFPPAEEPQESQRGFSQGNGRPRWNRTFNGPPGAFGRERGTPSRPTVEDPRDLREYCDLDSPPLDVDILKPPVPPS